MTSSDPSSNSPMPTDTYDSTVRSVAERTNRRALHAYVSDDAHDMWHGFAAENGVSVSALLEVLGGRLHDLDSNTSTATSSIEDLRAMIIDARKLDAARRSRRRR